MKKADHIKPIHIDKETWMYAERRGLCVVHDLGGAHIFYIPYAKLRRALRVRPRPKPKASRRAARTDARRA